MATCPSCGTSSRVDPDAMQIREELVAKPMGTWSLAGSQMKTTAYLRHRLSCRCGWSIAGAVVGEEFIGESATQTWPQPREDKR